MSQLKILQIEDSESDAALIVRFLEKAGLDVHVERAEDAAAMTEALQRGPWDAIVCDYRLPGFGAPEALAILHASGHDIPFIVVSGTIGEDVAVGMMRSGANDYLMKDNLARLAPAVEREIREARARAGHRETELQLRESQDRMALAVHATQLGTFDYYVPAATLVWSDVTRQQFGVEPDDEVSPALFWRRLHPEDRWRVRQIGLKAIDGKDAGDFSFEFRAIPGPEAAQKETEPRWFATWGRVLFDEAGKPLRIIGASRDITDQKRADEAFRYQLDLTRAIAHQTSDSIFVTDRNGCVTYMNPAAERVFGFTSAELVGNLLHDHIGTPGETARDHEQQLFRKDGTPLHVSSSSVPLSLKGETIGVVLTMRDITERKIAERALRESEARFRRLIDAGILGITIADRERILEANDYVISLLGHTRESFNLGTVTWRDITPPEHVAATLRTIELAVRHGSAPPIEKEYFRRDGSRVPVLVGGVVIDYLGRKCFMGFVLDQTAHRNLESQVRQSQKLETVGQLAGGIAHDFNNLLTVILGYSQMIMGGLDPSHPLQVGQMQDKMEQVIRAATRAASLTRQLLTFSRQDRSEAKIIRLNDVVEGVDKMLERLIGENVKTVLSLRQEAGQIRADAGHIEQVIVNLALNARDAMPDGGTIWIETSHLAADDEFAAMCFSVPPGEYVQLVVSDSGIGMTPEVKAKMFEPFFTTKGPGKGTGLGLSTVYGIVRQSGGSITVHSAPGHGTTFRILFPAVSEAASQPASEFTDAAAGSEPLLPADADPAGKGTVLVVEDQEGVLNYVTEILTRAGYLVIPAPDAERAFRLAAESSSPIDLLITDFILPGITGLEVAQRIQTLRPGTEVLIMSGYIDQLVRGEGAMAYLQKPFSADDLLSAVGLLLDKGTQG